MFSFSTSRHSDMSDILENFPSFSSKLFEEKAPNATCRSSTAGEMRYLSDCLEKERFRRKVTIAPGQRPQWISSFVIGLEWMGWMARILLSQIGLNRMQTLAIHRILFLFMLEENKIAWNIKCVAIAQSKCPLTLSVPGICYIGSFYA